MDPILGAALATGAADFLGGIFTNRSNASQAAKNRRFQERMSSTAAQRAVADYRAAGLNPALAYDRPASSPGGSVAQMENPVGKAVSSGVSAAMARKEIESRRYVDANVVADTEKKRIEGANALLQGDLLSQEKLLKANELAFRTAIQPHQTRAAALANLREQFGLSRAEAESAYYKFMGAAGPAIEHLAGPVATGAGLLGGASLLRGAGMAGSSAKGIQSLFRAPRPKGGGGFFKGQEPRYPNRKPTVRGYQR